MQFRNYLEVDNDDTNNSHRLSFWQRNKQTLDLLFETALTALSVAALCASGEGILS